MLCFSLNSASSAAVLVFDMPLCTHTTTEEKPGNEKTQYSINTLYYLEGLNKCVEQNPDADRSPEQFDEPSSSEQPKEADIYSLLEHVFSYLLVKQGRTEKEGARIKGGWQIFRKMSKATSSENFVRPSLGYGSQLAECLSLREARFLLNKEKIEMICNLKHFYLFTNVWMLPKHLMRLNSQICNPSSRGHPTDTSAWK